MAWEDVPVDESVPPSGPRFVKFEQVGQTYVGRFVKVEKRHPNGFRNEVNVYTFKDKDGECEITAPFQLDRELTKLNLQRGNAVHITYTKNAPSTNANQSPMKIFALKIDRAAPQAAAAPKPAPAAPPTVDDIPF